MLQLLGRLFVNEELTVLILPPRSRWIAEDAEKAPARVVVIVEKRAMIARCR